ncbi:MAG: glycosyltransferase [Calditrichia bacterium]
MNSTLNRKESGRPLISIVVVNYNVKDYLQQALTSFKRGLRDIPNEIFVVDNASIDGSVEVIRQHFPAVKMIENQKNVGFGKANNQALEKVQGRFVVIINPDTVVQEDTFTKLLDFFEENPQAAAATCKIINPDGTFSVDCRHSIPTPSIAFWKVTGLSKLFPKNRIFGQYNMTYLDPDEIYQVPAVSGSFMMLRREVLEEVGLFDERFFMYCEDIDLCHRMNLAGYKIFYVPTTQIIHYKGESTRKDNLDYVITFNRSLYQFFKKYYAPSSIFLFRWLVTLGILVRGAVIYGRNFLRNHFPLLLDTFILNIMIILAFILRMELKRGFYWQDFFSQYYIINIIGTILFVAISFYLNIYPNHRFSIQSIIKANFITFILLASITFFFKQFAFSRMVVLLTFIGSPILMLLWRAVLRRYYRGDKMALGKDLFSKPTVLIGNGADVQVIFNKLQARRQIDYELVGWVSVDNPAAEHGNGDKRYLGSIERLKDIIRIHRIRQVVFSAQSVSYEQILKTMSLATAPAVEYKMVPSNLEVIIGKSQIEKLDDYPLLDIEYSIGNRFNRYLKRVTEIIISFILLVVLFPVFLLHLLFSGSKIHKEKYLGEKNRPFAIRRFSSPPKRNTGDLWFLLWHVLKGSLSLVGAPLREYDSGSSSSQYWYKPGITGLVQLNREKIDASADAEKYHLFYLKNQSILLDGEILLKALWQRLSR